MNPRTDNAPTDGIGSADAKKRTLRYDEPFKLSAVRTWITSGLAAHEIAQKLGISTPTLYAWGRETRRGPNGSATARYMREMEEDVTRLREENAKLKQQCETLKKTLGILASFPDGITGSLRAEK